MFKLIVLLSVIACTWGAAIPDGMVPQSEDRIVGGESTNIGKFPWQVSLQDFGEHFCGGSIYNRYIIVTAAHCVAGESASTMRVRAGSSNWNSGGVVVKVAKFKKHPNYNRDTVANDVAVIRLAEPLNLGGNTMQSISLAKNAPENGAKALVSGWGTTQDGGWNTPKQLRFARVEIVRRGKCVSAYGYNSDAIKNTMICATAPGKDSCSGDSGGPLVSNDRLVGIVSWGYECASSDFPGVYADVAALRDWIVSTANSI